MAESGMAARKFRANKAIEGSPCHACGEALSLAEEVAQCNQCQTVMHARCWDGAGGCSQGDCENRPLATLPEEPPPVQPYASPPMQPYAPPPFGQPFGPQYPQTGGKPLAPGDPAALPGQKQCPHCNNFIGYYDQICVYCNNVTSPDGVYHGPRINAPGAAAALIYGVVGFFICGVIFGPIAISKANQAKQVIAMDPQFKGEGLATAGYVMGIVDVIKFVLVLLGWIIGGSISPN